MFFGQPFGGVIPGARGAVLAVLLRTGTALTGRQIHGLVRHDHSLWSVQEALRALARLGLVETQTIGRAGVHTINEDHAAIAPLRALADPVAALNAAIDEARRCLMATPARRHGRVSSGAGHAEHGSRTPWTR